MTKYNATMLTRHLEHAEKLVKSGAVLDRYVLDIAQALANAEDQGSRDAVIAVVELLGTLANDLADENDQLANVYRVLASKLTAVALVVADEVVQ